MNSSVPDPHEARGRLYVPFIEVHQIPSQGVVSRAEGWTTGRTHHLLSKLEREYFYLFDWSPEVVDIREQFRLPLSETVRIAEDLEVAHPRNPKTKELHTMTTDFVLTLATGHDMAVSVKYQEASSRQRVAEKLEIERLFWQSRQNHWKLATEKNLPTDLVANVEWIHTARDLEFDPYEIQSAERLLEALLLKGSSLREATFKTDECLKLEPSTAMSIVRHLLATGKWQTDMTERITPAKPLRIRTDGTDGQYLTRVA